MKSIHEFLSMGGYAPYVWPAYSVAALIMGLSAWSALRGFRRAMAHAIRRIEEETE